jgi:UDP-2-acetamido-3-amino-2,3-dideoxy-glucuronate N-acetyltransferase
MGAMIGQHCMIDATIEIPAEGSIGHYSAMEEGVIWNDGVDIGNYCLIEGDVELPSPCRIWHWVHVRRGVQLGVNVMLGSQCYIGPSVTIGHNTRIGAGAQVHEPAHIGNNVFIGPLAFIGNDKHPQVGKVFTPQPVVIGDDAVVSATANIMGGITIGEGAIIGMGSTVIKDVPPGAVVCGNPAVVKRHRGRHYIGSAQEHWEPVDKAAFCVECHARGLAQPNDKETEE